MPKTERPSAWRKRNSVNKRGIRRGYVCENNACVSQISGFFSVSKSENKGEWYIYSIAGSWLMGREKSASRRESLHQGGRWSEIEKGDIANKGDIVWDADDSQAARRAYICLWHQQLKTITCTLFLWPLSLSLNTSFISLPSIDEWHCSIFSSQVPADWSGYLSLSSFFSPCPCLGAFLFPFLHVSLQSTGKSNAHLSSDLVSKRTSIYAQ